MFELCELQEVGAIRLPGFALAALPAIEGTVEGLPTERAGLRLYGQSGLGQVLGQDSHFRRAACHALGPGAKPVRAILFDKSEATNWALGWHQDRTICVKEKIDTPGFGPWTQKQGLLHVAPPVSVLQNMVTLRIHLDPVPKTNAPLLVASGSHRFGRVAEEQVQNVVGRSDILTCLADAGDIWLYATLILHASEAATCPTHRRVLQVDYSTAPLPNGLQWAGV